MVTREQVTVWIDDYETAWRSAGTAALADLFTADATYLQGPFREPVTGLAAIAEMWEAERDGPGEGFDMVAEVLAVEGHTAVARVSVRYHDPAQEWLDLWVLRFDDEGRCTAFEEWPYAPPKP